MFDWTLLEIRNTILRMQFWKFMVSKEDIELREFTSK